MEVVKYTPIGLIHSPFKHPQGTPIQPSGGAGVKAEIEIFSEFVAGLQDLDGFSHIILIYHCHLARTSQLQVKPFLDDAERGVFATRAPARPNPIALSVVRLNAIADQKLYVEDIDILDSTPLLDLKPYVPDFDTRKADRIGWLEKKASRAKTTTDDSRFID